MSDFGLTKRAVRIHGDDADQWDYIFQIFTDHNIDIPIEMQNAIKCSVSKPSTLVRYISAVINAQRD